MEELRFLFLGSGHSVYYGLTLEKIPRRLVFHRIVKLWSLVPRDDGASAIENPAWAGLLPGEIASAAFFVDQSRPTDAGVQNVEEESLCVERTSAADRADALMQAWKTASPTKLIFGYEGKFALPKQATQPTVALDLKRAHHVRVEHYPNPEFRDAPQDRACFRVGRGSYRFDLPFHGAVKPDISGPEVRCLVAVGLTPPGKYAQRYKVAVGVLPLPSTPVQE